MRRCVSVIFTVLFVACMAAMLSLILLGRNDTTDFFENRTLAEQPAASREAILDGTWVNEWETWLKEETSAWKQQ